MKSHTLLSPLFALCAVAYASHEETVCGESKQPVRITARHIEANGVGYDQGYTTVEGFFTPVHPFGKWEQWVPFLDLRGHVFNNGKMAANAGLGCRYIASSTVFGVNAYYDYRNTKRQHYNQVSAGLEALGKIWDFRINGYLPVGWKNSPFFNTKFDRFKGHSIYLSRKRDFALKSANAEVGLHVDHFKDAPLYFAAGPYYLTGNGKTSWGGSLRAAVDLFDYVRLEGNTSYDSLFQWIGQGQISVNLPLGPKRKVKKNNHSSCGKALALSTRALQRVDRMEIIPIDRQRISEKAIDPATGQPWVVWFVDNTSSSNGTFESPFPTLLQAQNASSPNQIIYVFPGDGTSKGMNAGITLQNGQLFFGAGVEHPIPTTLGTITIPIMASSAPNITNLAGNVVSLANNNTVSGFTITAMLNGANGISGNGISNFNADSNTFLSASGMTTNGISLVNPSGQVLVSNNVFSGFSGIDHSLNGNGILLELNAGETLNEFNVQGNSFISISNPSNGPGGNGIRIDNSGGVLNTLSFSENLFNVFNVGTVGIFINTNSNAMTGDVNFSDNSFNNFNNATVIALGNSASLINNTNISQNQFNNLVATTGINFSLLGETKSMNFTNNEFNNLNSVSTGVTIGVNDTSLTVNSLNFSDNLFNNLSDSSALNISSLGAVNQMMVNRNLFNSIGNGPFDGFAARISSQGDICLQFTDNTAMPTQNPNPYEFSQSGGTFNRTVGSDSSTNIGQFTIVGTVGAPGSCSE